MNFKDNVLQLLESKGINQLELADKLGKSQPNVSMILKKNSPSFQTIREFAAALGVDVSDLTKSRDPLKDNGLINRLNEVISYLNLSIEDFSNELGYTNKDYLTAILESGTDPGYDFLNRFATSESLKSINLSWLITGVGNMIESTFSDKYSEIIQNTAAWDFSSKKDREFLLAAIGQADLKQISGNTGKSNLQLIKTESATEFRHLGNDRYLLIMPLVDEYVHDDYIEHWSEADFIEDLPKQAFSVDLLQLGTYKAFTVSDNSMNNMSYLSIANYDIVGGKKVDKGQWEKLGKKSKSGQDYIIVTTEEILIRRISSKNSNENSILTSCLNPDKEIFHDREISFDNISEIYSIEHIAKTVK